MQATAQAFRRWRADMQNCRHLKQLLSVVAGATAEALITSGFERCASLSSMKCLPSA
jgi:hypothetical protein